MRIVLDSNLSTSLIKQSLEQLGHEVLSIGDTTLHAAPDDELADAIQDHDILLTQDLHRQGNVGPAVHARLLMGNVVLIRFRPPESIASAKATVDWLLSCHDDWIRAAADPEAHLVTVTGKHPRVRTMNREESVVLLGRSPSGGPVGF